MGLTHKIKKRIVKVVIMGIITSSLGITCFCPKMMGKRGIFDFFINSSNKINVSSDVYRTTTEKKTKYRVIRVIDGDTFVVKYKGKEKKVRLIGVDTPESVHKNKKKNTVWGKKAAKYTKSKLTKKNVYLEFDKSKEDMYGRLLAYVYIKSGKNTYVMYNKTLVSKGYARAAYYAPNGKYRNSFEKLQRKAKKNKKGFWKVGKKKAFPDI